MRILLVGDDQPSMVMLQRKLHTANYIIDAATGEETSLALVEASMYDLILIDMQFSKVDCVSLCSRLRSQECTAPILLLLEEGSTIDKIAALDAGADDYVLKPLNLQELMAKIRVLLRRSQGNSNYTLVLTWGDLRLNLSSCEVFYQEERLSLTPTEYRLLELFLSNPQRVFSRRAILDRLWSFDSAPAETAVTMHIKDLRQKLKTAGIVEEVIETVYGLGYRLKSLINKKSLTKIPQNLIKG